MTRNNSDKRVIRTKKAIRTALFKLMESKDIASITISELTTLANVNRRTFYTHYSNITDILDETESEIVEALGELISQFDSASLVDSTYHIFIELNRLITAEYGFYCRVLLIFQKEFADSEHQDERRQHYGESGYARPKHSHARAVLFGYRGIAYIGCRIDTDRTGSHLADCYDVGKLLWCEPAVTGDYLTLYHGQHGVSAAEAEQADFKECVE